MTLIDNSVSPYEPQKPNREGYRSEIGFVRAYGFGDGGF